MRILIALLFSTQVIAGLNEDIAARKKGYSTQTPPEIKKVMKDAGEELVQSGIVNRAIKKGWKVPQFKLAGKEFSTFYQEKPVILKWYRGDWCPYCMMELSAYQKYEAKFKDMGYQLIAVSPDTKKKIAKTKKKLNITFPIYSDKDNGIARKFGIAFRLGKDLQKVYKGFGIDLKEHQGNSNNELPMPGLYVIDKKGVVIYNFVDPDYTKRLDPEDLFNVLKNLSPML